MSVLKDLEPKNVFYYFEEITKIPHPSYHEGKISAYLESFAREHNLECHRDELGNVIIIKEASSGYEDAEPLMIQGHMDMVAEQDIDCDKDMLTDGLDIYIDGDFIKAKGTTLGADDGIAVAYALALLSDDELRHPRLEFVCTVSEEVGMEGATGIDVSMCKSKSMINIDSEEEGYILCGCAGGARAEVSVKAERISIDESRKVVCIDISGLIGGHSGIEINKGRLNANVLIADILNKASKNSDIHIVSINGGAKDNAIPRDARAIITVGESEAKLVIDDIHSAYNSIIEKHKNVETEAEILVAEAETHSIVSMGELSSEDTKRVIDVILETPNGVIAMNKAIPELVETSLNLGILQSEDGAVKLSYATRSSVEESLDNLLDEITRVANKQSANVEVYGRYPAWEYQDESPLRDSFSELYERMYGKKPVLEVMHAGVECGLIGTKIKGLDCISIGPDMFDVHTPRERLSISSAKRYYELIRTYIEERAESH